MGNTDRIKNFDLVVNLLEELDVDGEMMEYVIEKVGMTEQMVKQLTRDKKH